jgi:hypothetical protein
VSVSVFWKERRHLLKLKEGIVVRALYYEYERIVGLPRLRVKLSRRVY